MKISSKIIKNEDFFKKNEKFLEKLKKVKIFPKKLKECRNKKNSKHS